MITFKTERTLRDGTNVRLEAEVHEKRIFPAGEEVYTKVNILNQNAGHLMGQAYFAKQMSSEELQETLETMNVEHFLFSMYR